MVDYDKLKSLNSHMNESKYATRVLCELNFASNLSAAKNGKFDNEVTAALDLLDRSVNEDGVITKTTAFAVEAVLMPLSADAKAYRVHCVAHAHIDMNWRWGYQETAAVTVDTFRTVLDLMNEYPELTFGQSQASTYEIIEKFAPSMLGEIKERIKEGRWDVSASTWVETDKNMPSGESLARHILYTKRYLAPLLGIPAESLTLDFEPDTFGHNITVPEICKKGGVKYYYHCRGNGERDDIYRWRAKSGAELLVYREPHWYNATVDGNMLADMPFLFERYGINCLLNVYGVGDHGGGPTRRDVERIIEMSGWPIMPTILFSTYKRFFSELEAFRDRLPIREGELNFVFDGCYTSESRIKMSNRIAEDRMYESEALGTAASLVAGTDFAQSFETAWRKILFNHFHDILPGSGVRETREYALGQFSEAMAAIGTNANVAMRAIAELIDTSSVGLASQSTSVSEGGGVGYKVGEERFSGFPCTERGSGKKRLFHFFNTTQYDFCGVTELTVFDWNYDASRAVFASSDGKKTSSKLLESGKQYWGHQYKRFALTVKVPAFGYASYTLDAEPIPVPSMLPLVHERVDTYTGDDIVLDNGIVRAVFDHRTMELKSFSDKSSGAELIDKPSCFFRYVIENTVHGMSAWRIGDYMKVINLNEACNVRVSEVNLSGIRKLIRYDLSFAERSKLEVTVKLDEGSRMLGFDTMIDFHEIGTQTSGIPQVNFTVPVGFAVNRFRYDVPFGLIDRDPLDFDVPANSFGVALNGNSCPLMLISDTKYGFRGTADSISLTLLRASYNPDPYPEYGVHNIKLGVGIAENADARTLYSLASEFIHTPAVCSARPGKRAGKLPLDFAFLGVDGEVKISSVKLCEDMRGATVRLSDEKGNGSGFSLTFAKEPTAAYLADLNENIISELVTDKNTVQGSVEPFGICTLLVKFD